MLTAKGWSVTITLVSGRKVRGAPSAALLHDESGEDWPKCSGLIMPIRKTGKEIKPDGAARKHFGSGYAPREGSVILPPRAMSSWHRVGEAAQIDYSRKGQHADAYYHPFEKTKPGVYRRGRVLRIELGDGCIWSWRGIVRP